jgi:cell growth-regulating nucleolar protein
LTLSRISTIPLLSISFYHVDDYRAHTSCISEAERYEGKLAKKPKKRNPQQEWTDLVEACVDTAPGHLKSYMRTMAGLDNIPRKEKQFRNFTANSLSLRGSNESIVGEIWNVLKTEREKRQKEREKQQKEQKERDEKAKEVREIDTAKKLEEKSSAGEPSAQSGEVNLDPKTVHKAMKKALKKAPNKSMKLKELRKLLGEKLGLPRSANKRLKKLLQTEPGLSSKTSKIKVDGKIIMLV